MLYGVDHDGTYISSKPVLLSVRVKVQIVLTIVFGSQLSLPLCVLHHVASTCRSQLLVILTFLIFAYFRLDSLFKDPSLLFIHQLGHRLV